MFTHPDCPYLEVMCGGLTTHLTVAVVIEAAHAHEIAGLSSMQEVDILPHMTQQRGYVSGQRPKPGGFTGGYGRAAQPMGKKSQRQGQGKRLGSREQGRLRAISEQSKKPQPHGNTSFARFSPAIVKKFRYLATAPFAGSEKRGPRDARRALGETAKEGSIEKCGMCGGSDTNMCASIIRNGISDPKTTCPEKAWMGNCTVRRNSPNHDGSQNVESRVCWICKQMHVRTGKCPVTAEHVSLKHALERYGWRENRTTIDAPEDWKNTVQSVKQARGVFNGECHTCGKKGHIALKCPMKGNAGGKGSGTVAGHRGTANKPKRVANVPGSVRSANGKVAKGKSNGPPVGETPMKIKTLELKLAAAKREHA